MSLFSQEFADENGLPFFETSAKDIQTVEQAFLHLTRDIKKNMGAKKNTEGFSMSKSDE